MKNLFAAVCLLTLSFVSCQEEYSPDVLLDPSDTIDNPIDTNATVFGLPKEIITNNIGGDGNSHLYIKYDSATRKITAYADNPATSGVYDIPVITYSFNVNGYLTLLDFPADAGSMVITRGTDNRLQAIVETVESNVYSHNITYALDGGLTKITDNVEGEVFMRWYNSNNLVKAYYVSDNEVRHYQYNANGSLAAITVKDSAANTEKANMAFEYNSGLPALAEDHIMKAFLGNDYYYSDVAELNTYVAGYDYLDSWSESLSFNFTNKYLPSKVTITHNGATEDVLNMQYQKNNNGLLTSIIEIKNSGSADTTRFIY